MKKSESIVKIAPKLLMAQEKMGTVKKDAANPFFRSKYADLNSIREVVIPVLHEHGISVLQATNGDQLDTILMHESGEFIASSTNIVVAKQNDPQAYGSALSYARRYGLQALLCVGAEDDDGEKAMVRGETKTVTKPKKQIVDDFG